MALLYNPLDDPSRVYYGTDTRAFSLLIGAWLAFVWPSHMLGAQKSVHLTKQVRNVLDGVGIVALVALLGLIVFVDASRRSSTAAASCWPPCSPPSSSR